MRLAIALDAREATVPVLYVDLSEAEEKLALVSLDPLAAMAEASRDKLAALLQEVQSGESALQQMLAQLAEQAGIVPANGVGTGQDVEPQIDRAEELRQQWDVELGQIWSLGEHRVLCGDCTDAAQVARVMGGEKADAVLTDPPYGQNQPGIPGDDPAQHVNLMHQCVQQLPCNDCIAVTFCSPRTFPSWLDAIRHAGWSFERMLWLYKAAQETFPWRGWLLTSEAILVSSFGKGSWQDVHPYSHDCYYRSEVSGELDASIGWHGSVKPLSVVADLLQRICAPGQLVYDPFLGSGTTLIACENLQRRCRGIEIDPGYVAVTLQRYYDATGNRPVLCDAPAV